MENIETIKKDKSLGFKDKSKVIVPNRKKMTTGDTIKRILFYVLLTAMVIGFAFPFIFVIYTSLRDNGDLMTKGVFSITKDFTFQNYSNIVENGFLKYLSTSAKITFPALLASIFLSSLAAYALAKLRFKGRKVTFFLILSCMYVPGQMLLIPIYRVYSSLGLTDSFIGIILLHTTLSIPFGVFVLRNFFVSVPDELKDAATIDGCTEFQTYYKIFMPLSLPSLAVLAILQFTFIWNSFMWELMLMTNNRPVMVGIANIAGEYMVDWAMQCTGAIIASLPTLAVFLGFQRFFIGGLTVGAVKG